MMEIRNVGRSGLRVSLLGLGCNNFGARLDLAGTRAVVERALDVGVTYFDTADSYGNRGGSERLLGEVLGSRRHDVVIGTKFASPMDDAGRLKGASRAYIVRAVEASLARLRTDYIDLYQLHWPDPHTPMDETLRALDDLVRAGKVRYLGCSNLEAWQVADAAWIARHAGLARFVSSQNELSLLARDAERTLFPALAEYGMGFFPYYPLASGLLSGKYAKDAPLPEGRLKSVQNWATRFLTDGNLAQVDALTTAARAHGQTLAELAFGWLAARPLVSSIIAGASTPAQVDANAAAVNAKLDAALLAEADRIGAHE